MSGDSNKPVQSPRISSSQNTPIRRSSFGGSLEKCCVCQKTVYSTERIGIDDRVFHELCFKCGKCSKKLELGTYASVDGQYYCKPHYQELFRLKGNYTEGFDLTNSGSSPLRNSSSRSHSRSSSNYGGGSSNSPRTSSNYGVSGSTSPRTSSNYGAGGGSGGDVSSPGGSGVSGGASGPGSSATPVKVTSRGSGVTGDGSGPGSSASPVKVTSRGSGVTGDGSGPGSSTSPVKITSRGSGGSGGSSDPGGSGSPVRVSASAPRGSNPVRIQVQSKQDNRRVSQRLLVGQDFPSLKNEIEVVRRSWSDDLFQCVMKGADQRAIEEVEKQYKTRLEELEGAISKLSINF